MRTNKPGNIGAVARAMFNFELHDLWLVAPRCCYLSYEAQQRSTKGERILRYARVVPTLTQAIDGCTYAVGASCRGGDYREQIQITPRQMAGELCRRAATGKAAIVFGAEDCGLRIEDLLACDAVVRIPSNPAYVSLNLSQAMVICAYELYVAAMATPETANAFLGAGTPTPANSPTLTRLMSQLEAALLRIGYLRPANPAHLLFPIRAILSRAALSQTEAQILIGLTQQIQEFADRHEK
ncbi:MAG: RNA methyltransferase [Phycisphaerae bacterium]|nr:RNA methyltransferase [Phycisphaerae bacterium]